MNPTPSLSAALYAIRSLGLVVVRTGRNTGLNSDYATYADIWEMLKPHLTEHKLAVAFYAGAARKEGESFMQRMTIHIAHESGESEQSEFDVLMPEKNRGTNITQCQGMSQTYGKRYALINAFNLIVGNDDDAARLGYTTDDIGEAKPDANAHWRDFCYCDLFELGTEENKGGWAILSNPANPDQLLGDLSPEAIAKLWMKFPNHAGINAWRAELINKRAHAAQISSWEDCAQAHKMLNLPKLFAECTGEQLNNLALALKHK
jgi:hypothetical protein